MNMIILSQTNKKNQHIINVFQCQISELYGIQEKKDELELSLTKWQQVANEHEVVIKAIFSVIKVIFIFQ